jgi:8-oxo-dGTP pyrophosphatase MutT (NUDIX family)
MDDSAARLPTAALMNRSLWSRAGQPARRLVRADLRERGLIGRGTYIMLFNSAGELCVHRRTLSSDLSRLLGRRRAAWWPQADETYAESAARELEEELGVRVELTAHDHFSSRTPATACGASAFSAVWDGPLKLQPEEVLKHASFRSNRCCWKSSKSLNARTLWPR